jgi:hypothetical protein
MSNITTEPRAELKPGVYMATYIDGSKHVVGVVLGPNHRPAIIPLDGNEIVTEIVEENWSGVVEKMVPLYRQGGLSGAMYWDDEFPIRFGPSE